MIRAVECPALIKRARPLETRYGLSILDKKNGWRPLVAVEAPIILSESRNDSRDPALALADHRDCG